MKTPSQELLTILDRVKNHILTDMETGLESPFMPGLLHSAGEKPGIHASSLAELEGLARECARCKLHGTRTSVVFGEGNPGARLMFIAEGPGRDEDLAGKPFVGEAGRLLTRIIEGGMGLKREDVYICYVVKCRPPDNRTPERDEMDACAVFLREQIRIIKPEVICTLGRTAVMELLGHNFRLIEERGRWRSFMDIPVMPTFHPAYILRNSEREKELKGNVWEDVKKIMTRLGLEVKK
jgi:uracil-DNA glycosylase